MAAASGSRADEPLRLRPRRRPWRRPCRPSPRDAGAQLHRRRHQPARPDEGGRRAARPRWSTSTACRWTTSRSHDGGLRLGALATNADTSPTTPRGRAALPAAAPRRSWPAPRRSCATWPPPAATCCSAPAATTSTTRPRPATSASPAPAARRIGGVNRIHAILGASEHCIATHPSDMCVALAALEADGAASTGPDGERAHPVRRLPPPARRHAGAATPPWSRASSSPRSTCPPRASPQHYTYLKLRDRLSYAFALVSVAAALELDGGTVDERPPRARRRGAQAVARPRGRGAARGQAGHRARASRPRPTSSLREARGRRRQRLQDRAGAARHRPRRSTRPPPARRSRSATSASSEDRRMTPDLQLHRPRQLRRQPAQPRRRPRQGDGPAPSTPPSSPPPDLLYGYVVSSAIAKGRITRDRHRRGRGRARRPRGLHAREPAAHRLARPQLPGRGGAARLAVPRRSTTTRSSSAASRSPWSWPRTSRPRAMRRRWCGSTTRPRRTRPTCERRARRRLRPAEEARRHQAAAEALGRRRQAPSTPRRSSVAGRVPRSPIEHHNPMEMHASTVVCEGDGTLTVYDKTQGVAEQPAATSPACSA